MALDRLLPPMVPRPDQEKAIQDTLRDVACEYVATKVQLAGSCWVWQGKPKPNGYGVACFSKKREYAHRFAYTAFVGPIPKGLQIDHLCKVRLCVNPDHLEAVTGRVNLLRGESFAGKRMRQTTCFRGHDLTSDNVRLYRDKRYCKACDKIRNATRPPRPRRRRGGAQFSATANA